MKTPCAAVKERQLTPFERLYAHLRTHMDSEYAGFLVWEIEHWVKDIKPRTRGSRGPHWLDDEIDELWKKINQNHTGGKKLGNNYWPTFRYYVHLLELRDATRTPGRPRNEDHARLILLLNDFYPVDVARKSRGGDFQETVRMTCDLAGLKLPKQNAETEHDGVHEMVCNALAYVDAPPLERSTILEAAWYCWLEDRSW